MSLTRDCSPCVSDGPFDISKRKEATGGWKSRLCQSTRVCEINVAKVVAIPSLFIPRRRSVAFFPRASREEPGRLLNLDYLSSGNHSDLFER